MGAMNENVVGHSRPAGGAPPLPPLPLDELLLMSPLLLEMALLPLTLELPPPPAVPPGGSHLGPQQPKGKARAIKRYGSEDRGDSGRSEYMIGVSRIHERSVRCPTTPAMFRRRPLTFVACGRSENRVHSVLEGASFRFAIRAPASKLFFGGKW